MPVLLSKPIRGAAPRYTSVFVGNEIAKGSEPPTPKVPPAIVSMLAQFGISVPRGTKYKVDMIDRHLAARQVSLDNRFKIKGVLRQIGAIE